MGLAVGTKVGGRFALLAPLGSGAFGSVWRARDEELGEEVAIKVLHADAAQDEQARERFLQEVRAARSFVHKLAVAPRELGRDAEHGLWFTMPLVQGTTLREELRARGKLDATRAVSIAAQVLSVLEEAHAAGLVHRDLKPENLMLVGDSVRVLDFGIAKALGQGKAGLTRKGTALGTPAYMSPEQARGEAVDARSDLWSVGVVLHEMLTGQRVFPVDAGAADPEQALMIAVATQEPKLALAEMPPTLAPIVRKSLAVKAGDRYQKAKDLREELERALPAYVPTVREARVPAAPRRSLAPLWVALSLIVVLGGVGAGRSHLLKLFEKSPPAHPPTPHPPTPTPTPTPPPAPLIGPLKETTDTGLIDSVLGGTPVQAGTSGRVRKVHVQEGARVEAGQVLVELDESAAKAELELASRELERARKLFANAVATKAELDSAETRVKVARANVEQCAVKAPFAGRVARVLADEGQTVLAGAAVVEVAADAPNPGAPPAFVAARSLVVMVRDDAGRPIANAQVSVLEQGVERARSSTDASGKATLSNLAARSCVVEVSAVGFHLVSQPAELVNAASELVVTLQAQRVPPRPSPPPADPKEDVEGFKKIQAALYSEGVYQEGKNLVAFKVAKYTKDDVALVLRQTLWSVKDLVRAELRKRKLSEARIAAILDEAEPCDPPRPDAFAWKFKAE